jgi:hypothetical protein
MRNSYRLASAPFLVLVLATTACDSDVKPVGDVLATDSTLALEVFGAKPDSATDIGDTAESGAPEAADATAPSTVPADLAVTPAPAGPVTPTVTEPAATERRTIARPASRTTSRVASTRRTRRQVAASTTRRATSRTRAATSARSTVSAGSSSAASTGTGASTNSGTSTVATVPSRGWLVIPVGAELEFEADGQICSNGDAFEATLSEGVLIGDGTVIPGGASAKGAIVTTASNDRAATPEMSIDWITFDGRTYKVSTRVTSATTKKIRTRGARTSATTVAAGAGIGAAAGGMLGRDAGSTIIGAASGAIAGAVAGRKGATYDRCVPDGGRIVAELTKPLRVLMTE